MTTAELSEQTDIILTNAVKRFLRRCPGAIHVQDFYELKHEAWLLLPGVEDEYDHRAGGNFIPFAVQRLTWRLVDLARTKTWAPRSISAEDRKTQFTVAPVGSGEESELILDNFPGTVTHKHPAKEFIEEDAVRGLADKLKSILPGEYRQAFELYYVSGLTMRETGEALGVTESRISQKLSLARDLIHERFPKGAGLIAD
jgi:RNA polymerase sigma factor (sigma-70 family)